ncbi:MAG: DNA-protecting protein DprA [Alphaproteobacteria bacterium]|nr:DNA-protecting protein DprA [Alphaproteobacteria bacterium]
MTRRLAAHERAAWLRLARTPRIGPLTFHRLIARHGGAEAALDALASVSRDAPQPPPDHAVTAELEGLDKLGAQLLCACERDYPRGLAALDAPPPVIAVRGDTALLDKPLIAMVGAREASAAGLKLAETIARDLGAMGYVVVSGLARGVDAAAHRASLESGTIAVLAGGLDNPYPPQNVPLHENICARGLVVSEAPLGAVARARDFPRRNHIISGLSLGVVVIEAALRSGTLITARAAGEQGRDVFAVPGSPLDPRAHGCNQLIKDGATLVECADDVAAALNAAPQLLRRADRSALPLHDDTPIAGLAGALARLLSPTPVHLNDLARAAGAPLSAVAAALMELELEGRAATLPGGYAASPSAAFSRPS